jgi:hypothetical protein
MLVGYENPELCSRQDQLQNTVSALFDLIEQDTNFSQVYRWSDGTLEIKCEHHHLWIRDNRVYTQKLKDFEDIPDDQKTDIYNCEETDTLCKKGCGCGCLIDLGYIEYELDDTDKECGAHCYGGKPS